MARQPPEQIPRTATGCLPSATLDLRRHLRRVPDEQEHDDRDDEQDLEHDERIDPVTHTRETETPDQPRDAAVVLAAVCTLVLARPVSVADVLEHSDDLQTELAVLAATPGPTS